MSIVITARQPNRERSGHPAADSPDRYEGAIDGRTWAVEIHPSRAPEWTGDLDADERDEVLAAIEALPSAWRWIDARGLEARVNGEWVVWDTTDPDEARRRLVAAGVPEAV